LPTVTWKIHSGFVQPYEGIGLLLTIINYLILIIVTIALIRVATKEPNKIKNIFESRFWMIVYFTGLILFGFATVALSIRLYMEFTYGALGYVIFLGLFTLMFLYVIIVSFREKRKI